MTRSRNKYPKNWTTKDKYRFRVYGITPEQYNALDRRHCPICLRPWSDTVVPCIDHDHKTGRIRGILCRYCNHHRVGRLTEPSIPYRIGDYLRDALKIDPTLVMPPKKPRKRKRKKAFK